MKKLEKKSEKNIRWPTIGRHTCREASTSGFPDSPGPPPSFDALGYVPAHRQGQRNNLQVWYFYVVFFGIRPHRPSGEIRPEYSPDDSVQWLRVKP
jgi:hypothetical protein